jgi:hypothetical protein
VADAHPRSRVLGRQTSKPQGFGARWSFRVVGGALQPRPWSYASLGRSWRKRQRRPIVSGELYRVSVLPKVCWGPSMRRVPRKRGASWRQPANRNFLLKSGSRVTPRQVAAGGRWSRLTGGGCRQHAGGDTCAQLVGADRDRARCAIIVVGGVAWLRTLPFAVAVEVGRLTRRPHSRSGCLRCVTL